MFCQFLLWDFNSEIRIMITCKVDNYISWEKISKIIQVLFTYSAKRNPLMLKETKMNVTPLVFYAGNLCLHNRSTCVS